MKTADTLRYLLFVTLCTTLGPLCAQQAGESVRIQQAVAEDVYAAGGTVDVLAGIDGDVVVAGGRITVSDRISGDLMAAGGMINVNAIIGDDVRIAGGDIMLGGTVGDDAIAAGGNVTLAPAGKVGGRAWFSGGRIDVAGTVGRELRAAGGRIVLSGRVNGDVELAGNDISILDSAIIDGDLVYRSPHQARIADGAQIRGSVRYEPVEHPAGAMVAAAAGIGFVFLLSLLVTGIALYLAVPRFIDTSLAAQRGETWRCLGLGLAVFAATPLVIGALTMTVIGWLPATVIGSLYMLLLLAGFLAAAFFVGDLGLARLGREQVSRAGRLWSFIIALIVIMLFGLIPLLGQLLLFALLLLGSGAMTLGVYRVYTAD